MPTVCDPANNFWIVSGDPESLREIHNPQVVLAIWERGPVSEAEPVLHALLRAQQPVRLDFALGSVGALESELRRHLRPVDAGIQEAIHALNADVADLAGRFAALTGRTQLRIRLERVEDDGCALFHVDTLPLRMLCTYVGPGTQWVGEEDVRRAELGLRGRSIEAANAAIVPDPECIRTVPAWHVLVFKGRLWEGHGSRGGLVHRSAPVSHPRDFRLRLTIDFADSCTC